MGLFARIFGICKTDPPSDKGSWTFSDGKAEISLTRAPELSEPGNAVRLEGKGLSRRILVVRGNDGQFHAFENRCTHKGSRLDPVGPDEPLQCCSVGQSTFDLDGKVISGPAKETLSILQVEIETDRVIVFL